ncbi:MAG: DUF1573 domain-containing protein [Candidatus Paceibacterota bacterium]|jgi:hypothetical protein
MKLKIVIIAVLTLLILVFILVWGYPKNVKNTGNTNTASVGDVDPSFHPAIGYDTATSTLYAPEIFYDFGTISMKDGNVEKDFTITNPTANDINLKKVTTSCMCTKAILIREDGSTKGPFGMPGMGYVPPANEIIKAGESRVIRAIYDPNAHGPAGVGVIGRFINLEDEAGNAIQLEIKALVKP